MEMRRHEGLRRAKPASLAALRRKAWLDGGGLPLGGTVDDEPVDAILHIGRPVGSGEEPLDGRFVLGEEQRSGALARETRKSTGRLLKRLSAPGRRSASKRGHSE